MSHILQERIILRNDKGGTVLDFDGEKPEQRVMRLVKWDQEYRFSPVREEVHRKHDVPEHQEWSVRTTLSLNKIEGIFLYVCDSKVIVSSPGKRKSEHDVELPSAVSAWLIILHDVARWARNSVVISFDDIPTAPWVKVSHERSSNGLTGLDPFVLKWPAPNWGSFLAHDIFRIRWESFLLRIKCGHQKYRRGSDSGAESDSKKGMNSVLIELRKLEDTPSHSRGKQAKLIAEQRSLVPDIRPRLLVCGWVACALETFFTLSVKSRPWVLGKESSDLVDDIAKADGSISKLNEIEKKLMTTVAMLYRRINLLELRQDDEVIVLPNRQSAYMRDWLEQELPLLLSPLYVPVASEKEVRGCCDWVKKHLETHEEFKGEGLLPFWAGNSVFILDQVNSDLAKLFAKPELSMDGNHDTGKECKNVIPEPVSDPEKLEHFGELHRFLSELRSELRQDRG
jgi:hypothetical protein